jgi:ferredoxin-NADP reductase
MTAVQEHAGAPPMWPASYVVAARKEETSDTVTLMLRPAGNPIEPPRPGQFTRAG